MLRDLLTTWETWSARDTLTRALGRASTDEARDALNRSRSDMPAVDPLDASRDAAELIALLQSWQWLAVHAARRAGASWEDIALATGTTTHQAHAQHTARIDQLSSMGVDITAYREAS